MNTFIHSNSTNAISVKAAVPAQRLERIVEICRNRRFISVKELTQILHASVPTVQRDLILLDRQGLLQRVRGGATATQLVGTSTPVPWSDREDRMVHAKRAIGRVASKMLGQVGCVFIANGTTTLSVVEQLDITRYRKTLFVTNGYPVARKLAEAGLSHLLLPGRLLTPIESVVGEHALAMVRNFHFDVSILGFEGIDEKQGLTDADASEALLKSVVANASQRVLGVCDGSKWNHVASAKIGEINLLHELITDRLPAKGAKKLKHLGVKITCSKHA